MLRPLAEAVTEPPLLVEYLRSLGYEVTAAQALQITSGIEPETMALSDAFELLANGGAEALGALGIPLAARNVLNAIARQISLALDDSTEEREVYSDLFNSLLRLYLGSRVPFAVALLEVIGVIVEPNAVVVEGDPPPPGGGRVIFDWTRLGAFLRDTERWASEVYGWGELNDETPPFAQIRAMARIAKLVDMLQIATTRLRPLAPEWSAALLGAGTTEAKLRIDLPLFQEAFHGVDSDGLATFDSELGLSLLPFSDPADRRDRGLAIAPLIVGSQPSAQWTSDGVELVVSIEADAQAITDSFLVITPQGWRSMTLSSGGQLSELPNLQFRLRAGLSYTDSSGRLWMIGNESGSKVLSAGMRFSIDVGTPDQVKLSVSAVDVQVAIDVGGDSLLRLFFSSPIAIAVGDMSIGFASGRGGFVDAALGEDGVGLTLARPVTFSFGPVDISRIILELKLQFPDAGGLAASAAAGSNSQYRSARSGSHSVRPVRL